MENSKPDIQAQLDLLKANYIKTLPEKLQQIEAAWKQLLSQTWNKERLLNLYNMIHKMAGSGATFGFPLISTSARTLEMFLQNIIESGILPAIGHNEQIGQHLTSLRQMCESAMAKTMKPVPTPAAIAVVQDGQIFVVDKDVEMAKALAIKLIEFGYRVRIFHTLAELQQGLQQTNPSAIIMDIMFPEGSGLDLISQMQQARATPIPVIFISGQDTITARLQAVRAGGYAYLTKPLDMKALQEKLTTVANKVLPSYRVLIVDDDPAIANFSALMLQQAGMTTEIVTDPLKILNGLQSCHPDLILMDVYMPGCNGVELAAVIRQQKEFSNVPIIFATAQPSPEKQLEAMIVGGDDFLTKPLDPQRLIVTVNNRLRRLNSMRVEGEQIQIEQNKQTQMEEKVRQIGQEMSIIQPIFQDGVLALGTKLMGTAGNSYEILKVLGQGGMGVTYLAESKNDKRRVVIKTLSPEGMTDVKVLMRFVQEGHTILHLNHENLVRGYDFYQGHNFCYLVMEFIEGKSIEDILTAERLLPPTTATKIVLGIAKALVYLETQHLIHRDIKPANIILTPEGLPKLVDFGIVKMTDRACSLTTPRIILGTPYYLSPEQTYDTNLDIRTDIYSLGASYFHMVTGELPFPGDNPIDVIQKRLRYSPNPRTIKPDLPFTVCSAIERMMEYKKEKRHRTSMELVTELEIVLAHLEP